MEMENRKTLFDCSEKFKSNVKLLILFLGVILFPVIVLSLLIYATPDPDLEPSPPPKVIISLSPSSSNYTCSVQHVVTDYCPSLMRPDRYGSVEYKLRRVAIDVGNLYQEKILGDFKTWKEEAKNNLLTQRITKDAPPLGSTAKEELNAGFVYDWECTIDEVKFRPRFFSICSFNDRVQNYIKVIAAERAEPEFNKRVTELLQEIKMEKAAAAGSSYRYYYYGQANIVIAILLGLFLC